MPGIVVPKNGNPFPEHDRSIEFDLLDTKQTKQTLVHFSSFITSKVPHRNTRYRHDSHKCIETIVADFCKDMFDAGCTRYLLKFELEERNINGE